jgi:hypothetical protein
MTTATRCPDAPDGVHLPTVQEVGERDARGQLVEGTFRRVCLHCQQEVT